MPKHKQSLILNNIDNQTALALAYQAMQNLNWQVLFAEENTLVARKPKNLMTHGTQIICSIENGALMISSEMIHGEMIDLFGINKKTTQKFVKAFNEIKTSTNEQTIENNKVAIASLRQKTIEVAKQEQAEIIEMNESMNLANSNLYATYTIIALNILIFILMAINGAGIFEPNSLVHIKWGSNYSPLTLSGDWWRLFTNIFLHFGIIHVAMNMYCLYTIGVYLEPMLGKVKYISAYVCTGILASLTSLWWHKDVVNSAGASGAVFGLYGLFLALLTSNLIPKSARMQLLQSIGIFVAYNLIYGMRSGVDNAAHVGGLLSGFIVGYIYIYGIKKEKNQDKKLTWLVPVIVIITAITVVSYLQQNKISEVERKKSLNEVQAASYADYERFNDKLGEFDVIHNTIHEITGNNKITDEELIKQIDETGMPKLKQIEQSIIATDKYDISPASHNKAKKLLKYIGLLKNELEILRQMASTKETESLMPQLNEITKEANALFNEIVKE